ncbi:MAG: lamin tail domain-containing protein, partial [Bacteroidota bacterium]|nr:lamin tail domain-containing protein [Bacteroidota bacterium]
MKKLFLLFFFLPLLALSQDLFISEYGEGSGYNKYIEIYNPTGASVDLSDYQIWKITNGGSWPESTLNLSGNLADDDVYIIYHSSSNINPIISSAGDVSWSQASWTGDDAVGLAKYGMLVDVVGTDGPDPGSGWDVAGVTNATKDHTLVRKCSVINGNTNWLLSAGTDSVSSEWIVLPQNDWSDIGQHTHPCQGTTVYGCTDSTATNYNINATIDDSSCTYCVYGCTGPTYCNYDSTATCDDGSCWGLAGCTDSTALNYNAIANCNDSSCTYCVYGCTNQAASNYDPLATCDDGGCIYGIYISEYGEGSGYNKYIEIYNGSGITIDLSAYEIWKITNGGSWAEKTLSLSGILAHDDTYIICSSNSSTDSIITSVADITWSQASWTGDDAVGLAKDSVLIDVIGTDGPDIGDGWDVAGFLEGTKDHTLVRKCDVVKGNTNWSLSGGTNAQNSEWIVRPMNDWSDLGQHTDSCQAPYIYGCMDSLALNYYSVANVNNGICIYPVYGCTNLNACNYDSTANVDDGSCLTAYGCTDSTATNYNSLSTCDDGSCCSITLDSLSSNSNDACAGDMIRVYGNFCLFKNTYPSSNNITFTAWVGSEMASLNSWDSTYIDITIPVGYGNQDVFVVFYDQLSNGQPFVDTSNGLAFSYPNITLDSLSSNSNDACAGDMIRVYGNFCLFENTYPSSNNITFTAWVGSEMASINSWDPTYIDITIPVGYGNQDVFVVFYDQLSNGQPFVDTSNGLAFSYCISGCTDSTACNFDSTANVNDGSCLTAYGCTDSTASNYDPNATCDDGSCMQAAVCNSYPTNLYVTDVIDISCTFGWDNMNTSSCMVLQYAMRYRKQGTTNWTTRSAGVGNGLCNFGLQTTSQMLLNLDPSTTYEWRMKTFYCGGQSSYYSPIETFTTAAACPDLTNLTVQTFSGNHTKAAFTWDTTGA